MAIKRVIILKNISPFEYITELYFISAKIGMINPTIGTMKPPQIIIKKISSFKKKIGKSMM